MHNLGLRAKLWSWKVRDFWCQCVYLSLSAYPPAACQEEAACESDGILDRGCSRVFQHWKLQLTHGHHRWPQHVSYIKAEENGESFINTLKGVCVQNCTFTCFIYLGHLVFPYHHVQCVDCGLLFCDAVWFCRSVVPKLCSHRAQAFHGLGQGVAPVKLSNSGLLPIHNLIIVICWGAQIV